MNVAESSPDKGETSASPAQLENTSISELHSGQRKYRECIYGEEALKISPTEPYCLRRPIRRGHLNVSQYYPMQQVMLVRCQYVFLHGMGIDVHLSMIT